MRKYVLPLAGFGLAVLAGAEMAHAASPAYCALYAREYANHFVQEGAAPGMEVSVQDQAYYRCLNRDEDPEMPTASAYFGAGVLNESELLGTVPEGDMSVNDEEPVAPAPQPTVAAAPAPAPAAGQTPIATQTAASDTVGSRSRRVPWTPEWVAWCSSHFPNSFDLETGMVIPLKTNRREFCD